MRASVDRLVYSEAQPDRQWPDAGLEGLLRAAVDCLRQGVILVDRSSHVVFANREAQTILAAHGGLHDGPTGLRAETMELTRRFRRMVEAATAAASASATMALPRRALPHPLSVLVTALRPGVALVLIIDPDRMPTPWPDQLRQLYGLTDAEAAVTVAVTRGEGLAAVAARLDVGLTTARTHLQHVFQKTGTQRQAQLVRLIVAGSIGLRA